MTNRSSEVENLETFSLLWLSNTQIDPKDRLEVELELRAVINYFSIFEDEPSCLEYIHSRAKSDRLILIVASQFAQQLLPQIVHLRHISTIYIHNNDKQNFEQWPQYAKKVKTTPVNGASFHWWRV